MRALTTEKTTMTDLTMSQFASKDDLLAAQAARIAELEADLEAVGAGGVEPLRKCNKLHQIAEPAQDARTAFEAISRFMKCEWNLDWDPAGFYDDAKTDAAFTWFEQGYMRAQQAAAPQAVQDAMPKWIDDPHDIEQGQMLNPEWVKLQQADAPAHPAEGVHAAVIAGAIFDFAGYLTTLPHEKALHCSEAHEASPMVEAITEWCKRRGLRTDGARVETWRAALAAAQPAAQGMEQDAARYQALVESGNFAPSPFDNGMWGLRASSAPSTKAELDAAVDRVIAAQAKQGEQANG